MTFEGVLEKEIYWEKNFFENFQKKFKNFLKNFKIFLEISKKNFLRKFLKNFKFF